MVSRRQAGSQSSRTDPGAPRRGSAASTQLPSSPLLGLQHRFALSAQNLSPDKIFHVIVAPCYDRKLEALGGDPPTALHGSRSADCVLTSGERLACDPPWRENTGVWEMVTGGMQEHLAHKKVGDVLWPRKTRAASLQWACSWLMCRACIRFFVCGCEQFPAVSESGSLSLLIPSGGPLKGLRSPLHSGR